MTKKGRQFFSVKIGVTRSVAVAGDTDPDDTTVQHASYLDSVEVDVEAVDLRSAAIRQFDELGTAFDSHVQRDLEVVFLLTDERIVLGRKVETLVGVHAVPNRRTVAHY